MVAYVTRMPQGVPGDISRQSLASVETQIKNPSLTFPSYGVPGKIVSGKFVPVATASDGGLVYGFLVRPFPTQGANATDPLGTGVPATTGAADVMRRGYMTVKNNAGTPALDGQVYVRVANAVTGQPIGGIEAAADGGNCEAVPDAKFMSAADAAGNVEISYKM